MKANGKTKPMQNENKHLWRVFKNLRELIPKYGLNKKHACVRKAMEFIFKYQTALIWFDLEAYYIFKGFYGYLVRFRGVLYF